MKKGNVIRGRGGDVDTAETKLFALLGNYDRPTARLTDRPTHRRTDRVIGKFHFQLNERKKKLEE